MADKDENKSEVREPVEEQGEERVQPVVLRPESERDLLVWEAPSRLYKERDREFWVTIFTMGGILGLILFFIEGWMPVAVIVAFVFLTYVMSTVPPEKVQYKLTNKGLVMGGKIYRWGSLLRFWFDTKLGQKMVLVDAVVLPGRFQLLLGEISEEEMREVLKTYLIEEKPKEAWVDQATKWVNKRVPLE